VILTAKVKGVEVDQSLTSRYGDSREIAGSNGETKSKDLEQIIIASEVVGIELSGIGGGIKEWIGEVIGRIHDNNIIHGPVHLTYAVCSCNLGRISRFKELGIVSKYWNSLWEVI
jgi:hypothetical protein